MKNKVLLLSILMLLFLGVQAQSDMNSMKSDSGKTNYRQMWKNRMERQRGGDQHGMFRDLNLTDEQKKALEDIHLEMYKEMMPVENQLGEAQAHQKTLLSADQPNIDAINANIEKIGSLKMDLAKIRVKYLLEMRSKLSDEQRMKMEMMMEHHQGFGMQGGQMGCGMHRGQMGGMDKGYGRFGKGMQ